MSGIIGCVAHCTRWSRWCPLLPTPFSTPQVWVMWPIVLPFMSACVSASLSVLSPGLGKGPVSLALPLCLTCLYVDLFPTAAGWAYTCSYLCWRSGVYRYISIISYSLLLFALWRTIVKEPWVTSLVHYHFLLTISICSLLSPLYLYCNLYTLLVSRTESLCGYNKALLRALTKCSAMISVSQML